MAIWKYPLPIARPQVEMPTGARALTVQEQDGAPTLWALVDPSQPFEIRHFVFHPTGAPIREIRGAYVGTVQLYAGSLVLHCFEDPL